mmetsp:Transcript_27412/g.51331  ORF Transcript_27412/g.51331 Transcript_27412/m.51331 type:complete len:552 (+) Transcript_27412:826-2481(+)
MQHSSWQLIAGAPGVTVGVGSALVSLPKVPILRSHIALHGLTHNQVAHILELGIIHAVAFRSELRLHCPHPVLLQKLEEGQVLHHRHLDDLRNSVPQPSWMKGLPEATVRDREHRRVVGAVQVLVVVAVAAHARRRAGIDAGDNRGAEHHVWSVAGVQRCGKAGNVRDDTTADNQQGLVTPNGVLLHCHQNALHVLDALVHLVAAEHKLGELDVVAGEVIVNLCTIVLINLVIHHSHAPPQWLVHIIEQVVGGVQHLASNLDGGRDGGAHHRLDRRSILRGQSQGIALPVDGCRIDCVCICLLQVCRVLHVLCMHFRWKLLAHLFDGLEVRRGLAQAFQEGSEVRGCIRLQTPGQALHEDRQLTLRQVPEVFELLEGVEKVKVIFEGEAELVREDGKPGDGHQGATDLLVAKGVLHLLLRRLLTADLAAHGLKSCTHGRHDLGAVDGVQLVVVDLRRRQIHLHPFDHIATTSTERLRRSGPLSSLQHGHGAHCCHAHSRAHALPMSLTLHQRRRLGLHGPTQCRGVGHGRKLAHCESLHICAQDSENLESS